MPIIGSEPSPEFAAMVAEEYHRRLEGLGDETLRRIAELKLACHSNEEIRQQLGCSLRSVTLKLELIRKKWQWVKGRHETFANSVTRGPVPSSSRPGSASATLGIYRSGGAAHKGDVAAHKWTGVASRPGETTPVLFLDFPILPRGRDRE